MQLALSIWENSWQESVLKIYLSWKAALHLTQEHLHLGNSLGVCKTASLAEDSSHDLDDLGQMAIVLPKNPTRFQDSGMYQEIHCAYFSEV